MVAIHQSPAGQKHQRRQPVDELPSDDSVLSDDGEEEDEDDEEDIKAQIYVDCHFVGTIALAGSLRHMIQQSTTAALQAVNDFLLFQKKY